MAFEQDKLALTSAGLFDSLIPQQWNYISATDALATIKASAYFNLAAPGFHIGDWLYILGTDGSDLIRITAITPNVTVSTMIDALTLNNSQIFVGNASNEATGVAMSGDTTISNTGVVTIGQVLDADNVTDITTASGTGSIDFRFRIVTPGGAGGNVDVVLNNDIKIADIYLIQRQVGTASDTVQVINQTTTNAITDAMDVSGAQFTRIAATTIDTSETDMLTTNTIRVTQVDGAGADSPICEVYIIANRD